MFFRVLPLAVLLAMAAGCRAVELQAEPESAPAAVRAVPATHQPVPAPPEATGSSPVLWVSLDDHLGRSGQSPLLTLRSSSGPLMLEDAAGQQWSSPAISIGWRSVPLDTPMTFARRVAGPFASFESADRVAQRWRGIGVTAEV
ncbi:MAG: amidase, partial [Synechococcus sp. TMED20]